MKKNILIIQGHPDSTKIHFCHALENAYQEGAESTGNSVKKIYVATTKFNLLKTKKEFDEDVISDAIRESQETILWAEHIVIIFPLWLGTMPAILKGFFEHVFCPEFSMKKKNSGHIWIGLLKGKSARLIVTMGMPVFFYRWFFFAHGLKNLQRNILSFRGIKSIKTTLIGSVDEGKEKELSIWITKLKRLGEKGI